MSKAPPGSYPKQVRPYPTQPAYPTQPQQMQYQPPGQYGPPGQAYGVPPPPYSEAPPQPAPSGMYNPQQVPYIQHYPSMAPGGHYPRQQYPVGQYPAQGPPQPAVHGSFDPGARFGTGATVNVPPPPPGYAPNAAQVMASQGQPVNVQQRQAGWFSGGTDGGYTMW